MDRFMVTNFPLKSSVLSNAHLLHSRIQPEFKNIVWGGRFFAPSYRKNDLKMN